MSCLIPNLTRALTLLSLFIGPTLLSASPTARYLLGFEVEMTEQMLSNLVPHFDLPFLESRIRELPITQLRGVLPPSRFENYLQQPGTLESLSPALRGELTQGLTLNDNLVDTTQSKRETSIVQLKMERGADANLPIQEPKLTLPAVKNQTNAPAPDSRFHLQNGIYRSKSSDWQILNDRWSKLPWDVKIKEANFSKLSPFQIARSIMFLPSPPKDPAALAHYLRLKPDASPVLQKLNFSLDDGSAETGRVFEANLKAPTQNENEFLADLNDFEKLSGTTTQIEMPTQVKRGNVAYHFHFTPLDTPLSPSEYHEVIRLWQNREVLKLLNIGPEYTPLLDAGAMNSYEPILHLKGGMINIRQDQYRDYHTEVRVHRLSPKLELEEFKKLTSTSLEITQEQVNKEIQSLFNSNPSLKQTILQHQPELLAAYIELKPELIPELRHAILEQIESGRMKPDHAINLLPYIAKNNTTLDICADIFEKYPSKTTLLQFASALRDLPERITHYSDSIYRFLKLTHEPGIHIPHQILRHLQEPQKSELLDQYFKTTRFLLPDKIFYNALDTFIEAHPSGTPLPSGLSAALKSKLLDIEKPHQEKALKLLLSDQKLSISIPEAIQGLEDLSSALRWKNADSRTLSRILTRQSKREEDIRKILPLINWHESKDLELFANFLNTPTKTKTLPEKLSIFSKHIQFHESASIARLEGLLKSETTKQAFRQSLSRYTQTRGCIEEHLRYLIQVSNPIR